LGAGGRRATAGKLTMKPFNNETASLFLTCLGAFLLLPLFVMMR
jgi:hypothetical protein